MNSSKSLRVFLILFLGCGISAFSQGVGGQRVKGTIVDLNPCGNQINRGLVTVSFEGYPVDTIETFVGYDGQFMFYIDRSLEMDSCKLSFKGVKPNDVWVSPRFDTVLDPYFLDTIFIETEVPKGFVPWKEPSTGLYGYRNREGQLVIKPQFIAASEFEGCNANATVEYELKDGSLRRKDVSIDLHGRYFLVPFCRNLGATVKLQSGVPSDTTVTKKK